MARYCGGKESGPILSAAQRWKDACLLRDGSVFSSARVWRDEHLQALQEHFVDAPDEGEGTFFSKLEGQLASTAPEAKQLAAEMLWVMFLCPSNVTPQKKREGIQTIWGWSGAPVDALAPWLTDEILAGVGSAGTSFGVHRWRELAFFIRAMRLFKALPDTERSELLADGWKFAQWLEKVPEADARQLRHMLLFLLFPDSFERIFGGGDRRLIVQNFAGMSRAKVRSLSAVEIDRGLAMARAAEQDKLPDKPLDFYESPLREQWQTESFDGQTAAVEREHVLEALREIDEKGVPPDAESTVYDLIQGTRRYPPKLVLSLASKHAGGKEFDRSLFSGGVDSPAFSLLRGLGFHIERKDFLPSLVKQFLAQATEGTSLVVRGYPDSYRGLAVKVSFGKGTLARVPWICFLEGGQEAQDGIFPVLQYHKADGVLLLARGVSETATPALRWPSDTGGQTIQQYYVSHFGRSAERYGESTVYAAYRVPADVAGDKIAADIDALIAEYQALLDSAKRAAPKAARAPTGVVTPVATVVVAEEPVPERPFTVKEAAEGLFIAQARFEQILAIWRHKQNLVVQGPPGVGKTYFFRRLAYALMGAKAPGEHDRAFRCTHECRT